MHMKRLIAFLKGDQFRELFIYGIVGLLTTAVNWLGYAAFSRGLAGVLGVSTQNALLICVSTVIGWAASVIFAFWANKKYVFRSADWSKKTLMRELPEFITARLLSLGFDAAFVSLTVKLAGMNDLVAKLVSNIIVIVLNYFASKFWIFRKKGS